MASGGSFIRVLNVCRIISSVPATMALALAFPLLSAKAFAQGVDSPWEIGLGAGTAGVQFSASYRLTDHWRLRGVAGGLLTFRASSSLDGNEYQGNLDLGGIGIFGDYYPFKRGFRVSGGLLYSLTDYGGTAEGLLNIGDELVLTRLDLDLAFSPKIVPTVTVGYDLPLGQNLMMVADLGVIYPLGYDATLRINGNQPIDLSQLVREIEGIEADSPDVFPYLSIGLVYRF
jgi:hypothetical protein